MLAEMFGVGPTPTRLPPPPRKVVGGVGCIMWGLRLFILPHMYAGGMIIGQFALAVLVAAFGTDVDATVTKARPSETSKGGTIYYLEYRYSADGQTFNDTESVGAGTYAAASRPEVLEGRAATVRVRHLAAGPARYHLFTQEHSAWGEAGEKLFFALFWNGILSVFVYLFWVRPIRERRLVRYGEAIPGTIVSTRERKGRGTTYYATFRFNEPASGQAITREMELRSEGANAAARPGLAVTVLCHPRHPRRALVYELCAYRVADSPASMIS